MKKCIICSFKTLSIYSNLDKCINCGHATFNQNIKDSRILEIYNNNYFKNGEYKDYKSDENIIKKNFQKRINRIINNHSTKDKKLIEIGSAYGFFLDLAKNNFESVSGVEISNEAFNYSAKKFNMWKSINNVQSNSKFDFICLWDVIEHLKDPKSFLLKTKNFASQDNILAFTTGDINSINARIFKSKWRLIHPPTHLNYFTKKSVEIMLKELGYKILFIDYVGYHRSLDFIIYKLNKLNWFKNRQNSFNFFKNISIYINLFDIMYVEAKRIY